MPGLACHAQLVLADRSSYHWHTIQLELPRYTWSSKLAAEFEKHHFSRLSGYTLIRRKFALYEHGLRMTSFDASFKLKSIRYTQCILHVSIRYAEECVTGVQALQEVLLI